TGPGAARRRREFGVRRAHHHPSALEIDFGELEMKISDARLAMIGAQSARWPAADTNAAWRDLHFAITAIREAVRMADIQISEKEADADLSAGGRLRAIGGIGLGVISHLQNLGEVATAENSVQRMIDQYQRGAQMPAAATDPLDIAIGGEIRAWLAGQKDSL